MTSERMIMVPEWLVEESASLIEQAGLSGTGVSLAAPRLRATLAQPAAGEPVLWQVRHFDNDRGWGDWEEVVPRSPALGQTVEHRLQEYRELIGRGYRYELRALGIVAPPAAAHGDGLHFNTTEDLASAIRQVSAYEDLGPELIAEEMFKQAGASFAHGYEAVRKDAEAAYIEMTCQPVLIDGAHHYYLSSERMQAFDRLFSVDFSDAAMRAQAGEGGE